MIRILLAHSSRLVCESLRTALAAEDGLYVIGCATTREQMHFLLPHAGVVLLGNALDASSRCQLLDEIRCGHPTLKVLVLGVDEQPEQIIRYIEAGAFGYILQNDSLEAMVTKLQAAHAEQAVVSPSIAAALIDRLANLANMQTPFAFAKTRQMHLGELTEREQEVLSLIAEGCTNRQIAQRLYIECGTVKNHVHSIIKKLEVNNRHEAASIYQIRQAV